MLLHMPLYFIQYILMQSILCIVIPISHVVNGSLVVLEHLSIILFNIILSIPLPFLVPEQETKVPIKTIIM